MQLDNIEVSPEELAEILAKKLDPNKKEIVLLSCNDLASAQALAQATGKKVYTTDGAITIFENGIKRADNTKWYEVSPDGTAKELSSPPVKECSTCTGDGVEMGINGTGKALDDIVLAMKNDFPSTWKFNKIGDDAFEVLDGTGKKWGTVYNDKIVCPARTQIGTAGNPILNKATLVKNMKYEVDGIIYQTDDLGRVLTTKADLDDIARVRLGNQQIRAVDVKDGVRGVDQGGHIVGSRFFGPGEQINLYPQSANLNQGLGKLWKTVGLMQW
ncbi:DNA/RNA non-specific endonuclease [Flavobacterium covae]|nr:DNA/RNA non-specific endonuclease [Flavobacterium covae]